MFRIFVSVALMLVLVSGTLAHAQQKGETRVGVVDLGPNPQVNGSVNVTVNGQRLEPTIVNGRTIYDPKLQLPVAKPSPVNIVDAANFLVRDKNAGENVVAVKETALYYIEEGDLYKALDKLTDKICTANKLDKAVAQNYRYFWPPLPRLEKGTTIGYYFNVFPPQPVPTYTDPSILRR